MKTKILEKLKNTQLEILDEVVRICHGNSLDYFLIGGTLLGAIRHKGYIPWDDDLDICMPRKDYEKFIKISKKSLGTKFTLDEIRNGDKYWLPFLKVRNRKTLFLEEAQKNYFGEKGIWIDIFPLDNSKSKKSLSNKIKSRLTHFLKGVVASKSNINSSEKIGFKKIFNILPRILLVRLQYLIMASNKNSNSKYFINLGSQYKIEKQTHPKSDFYPAKDVKFENKSYKGPNNCHSVLCRIYGIDYMTLPPKEKRITHKPMKIKFEDGEEIIFNEKI